jgi:bleomycin hydrolase
MRRQLLKHPFTVFARKIVTSRKMAPLPISTEKLSSWDKEVQNDPRSALAATVFQNVDVDTALINRGQYIKGSSNVFSDVIETEGAPITNQKSSGRCWLFAATNVLRTGVMRKYNLENFQLSPSFLFFYDKLEKSNYFLDQIAQTADEDIDSRIVQHLLTDPICDGGQFDMFANIVEKYGVVPNTVFPDSFNTLASNRMNFMITTLLRQYAQELRETIKKVGSTDAVEVQQLKDSQIKEIHRLLTLFLGNPPGPHDSFRWEFKDKDKKFSVIESTPLKYYKEVVEFNAREAVSLLNDPRNPYNRVIKIDRLGNVVGEKDVSYLNLEIDALADAAIAKIKKNEGVFFGTHTPIYHDKKSGIMDIHLWDHKLVGYEPTQAKADRLKYHQSLMTHAMVITGVHLEDGKPVRWRVENSWGDEVGQKGYFTMTHHYFKEYVYQVVVDKKDLPELAKYLDDKEPIVLPPWDPCGALAKQ